MDAETFTNKIEIFDTSPSTSYDGAILSWGGISVQNTEPASSLTQGGGITVMGGVSITENTIHGREISLLSTINSIDTSTGSLVTLGGIGVQGSLNVANKFDVSSYQTGTSSTSGQYINIRPSEFRDSFALAGSTIGNTMFNTIDIPTVSATNANVYVANASTLYIKGGPRAGVNVTVGNSYSLVANGDTRLENLEVTGVLSVLGITSSTQDTYISDTKSQGTNGGDFIKNAWRTRDLNTISGTSGGASISANTITLSPGSYNIIIVAPSYDVASNKIRLFNVTNSSVTIEGTSNYSDKSNNTSTLFGQLNVVSPTQYRVQHYSLKDNIDTGLGRATGIATTEIYTRILLQRLSTTPSITPSVIDTYISDIKTQGTNGGTFLKNAWRTRQMNTISSTSGGVTLSANTLTLLAGSYSILSRVPSYDIGSTKARLFNVTLAQSEIESTAGYSDKSNNDTWISGVVNPISTTSYTIQQYSLKDNTDTGFGRATGIANTEVYTTVYIKKTA